MRNFKPRKTLAERFSDKWIPVTESGCWIWLGKITAHGYGVLSTTANSKTQELQAHRASYQLHRGQIPSGMFVCHSCDVTQCVNPNHLFLGTNTDNMIDCRNKGRAYKQISKEVCDQIQSKLLDGVQYKQIKKLFGVSAGSIANIKYRKRGFPAADAMIAEGSK